MDRRTARSLDKESKKSHSTSLLRLSQSSVLRNCNPVQFLAMAIREASDMLVYETSNLFNPVQFSEMEMMPASEI